MADKKQTMTRQEIEAALARGERVAIGGRQISHKRDLPPVPLDPEGKPGPDVHAAVIARTADGRLTHAGMVHAIEHGGSVMHKGEVVTKVEDLPDEAELVRHDAQQRAALAQQYDAQMAALAEQKAKLTQAPEEAEEPRAASHAGHATHPDHGKKKG